MTHELIPYASRTGTRRNLAELRRAGWRLLVSAAGCLRSEGFCYALDNGAWSAYTQGKPFDEKAFARALRKMGAKADWTVIPDIVAGGLASLELSLRWMRIVLDECPRALLAVQDGMSVADVAPFLGPRVGLFVGGSTEWKCRTLAEWGAVGRAQRCWVHVGRVNSKKRISSCATAGATSFDGTSVTRFAISLLSLDEQVRQLTLGGLS
jgi:hypothetical protein